MRHPEPLEPVRRADAILLLPSKLGLLCNLGLVSTLALLPRLIGSGGGHDASIGTAGPGQSPGPRLLTAQICIRCATTAVISAMASSTGTPFFCSPLR